MTGYEQVRSIAAKLAGHHAAAERVELILPETGVCGGASAVHVREPAVHVREPAVHGGCCAVPETLTLSAPSSRA